MMKKVLTLVVTTSVLLAIVAGVLYFKPSISGNVMFENNTSIYVLVKNVSSIGGVEVKIVRDASGTKLLISNSEISSKVELVERDKKVYAKTSAGEKEIKVLPWDAEDSAKKIGEVEVVEIEEYEGKPVYSISGTKKAYLFFVIPLTAEVNQKINLEDGKVVYTKKPWWHFLALGV